MDNFTYIIIDDEPKAIRMLEKKIAQCYDNMHMQASYTSCENSLDILKKDNFDVLFLDISMPCISGLALMEQLPGLSAEVIFVTAHEEYALSAFNFTPAGYILKPINDAKLNNAIDKAQQRVRDKKTAAAQKVDKLPHNNKIGIRNNKGIDYVNVEDILYMEALSRYTKVVTSDKVYLSSYNIGKLKMLVEPYDFYSVHRSFLVNVNKVKRYESTGIVITEQGHEIPVSKNIREDFLHLFNKA